MMDQLTEEWFTARCGKATASRIADITAKTKTGWGASRGNYAAQLVAERLTGKPAESYSNAAMQWGNDKEPDARNAYAFYQDVDVEQVGFIDHPRIAMSGASPDGLVGSDGLVEIKCPNTATHIDTLLSCVIPAKYQTQMTWQIACTGRAWCDFVSFDPRMPSEMQLFVKRFQPDTVAIQDMESAVSVFLSEVANTVKALQERFA